MKPSDVIMGHSQAVTLITDLPTIKVLGRTFSRTSVLVHFNIVLYAACFWIQIGVLPVSSTNIQHYNNNKNFVVTR